MKGAKAIMGYDDLIRLQNNMNGKAICFFGAGLIGSTWAYDLFKALKMNVDYYCDNNKKEGIVIRDDVKTISPATLYALKDNVVVFLTTTSKYHANIRKQLNENGIYNIIEIDYLFLQTLIEELLMKNDERINEKFKAILDDAEYISSQFEYYMGFRPDLDNPRTFNEKIQWLKLYDRKPYYTQLVDKYEVKKYIADKAGSEYVVPTIGLYNTFDEIDFADLPKEFVLKCTHDSGSSIICKNKDMLDRCEARNVLESGLKRNYYWVGREWPYKNVKPRIIAESFLHSVDEEGFIDYKFLCMDGKVKLVFTCSERWSPEGLCVNFYDRYWNPMPFERHYRRRKKEIEKPEELDKMISLAEILSEAIKFVRVDFYVVGGHIYVGEMTFYPGNGVEEFTPDEWDNKLGEMIELD